ncbi:MAG TPA: hypothetical protein ENH82_06255 [bacterium]|nr:hypothetical protein [bacterium]
MSFKERIEIIKNIEELRKSKVVTYITSDRRSFPEGFPIPAISARLGTEAQIFLYEQLRLLGKTENLDLFIYSRGGQIDSVWPLISIFREFKEKKFTILVPFRAHSAATLICLGADNIVMGDAGELSPIDPTTGNQFNPIDEFAKNSRKGISVEDVTSYIELAKEEKVGLEDPNHILEVFKRLTEEINPIALGNVNRAHSQIRILAQKLLKFHFNNKEESNRINKIVDHLTKKLYSHTHAINRVEAKEIFGEDFVRPANIDEQNLLWKLYEDYENTLELREAFCADKLITSNKQEQKIRINGAFIETKEKSFVYQSQCQVNLSPKVTPGINVQVPAGQPLPLIPGLPVNVDIKILSIGWINNEKGV